MQVCQVSASSSLQSLRRRKLNIFRKFTLDVTLSTNQIKRFLQKTYETRRTTQLTFLLKLNSNIPNDLAKIVNFHYSHYKSMGTLSCHSNQSSYPIEIKNTTFVEGNVLSMYDKFRLHPPYGF